MPTVVHVCSLEASAVIRCIHPVVTELIATRLILQVWMDKEVASTKVPAIRGMGEARHLHDMWSQRTAAYASKG